MWVTTSHPSHQIMSHLLRYLNHQETALSRFWSSLLVRGTRDIALHEGGGVKPSKIAPYMGVRVSDANDYITPITTHHEPSDTLHTISHLLLSPQTTSAFPKTTLPRFPPLELSCRSRETSYP